MKKASRHRGIMASRHRGIMASGGDGIMASRHHGIRGRRHHGIMASRAFTLTELMIAVAMLVGVLLAVGKIFSTTSQVTGFGQATADLLQESAAIERQIRSDFEKLSYDGFFAVRCVAVPNDIHWPKLLNPSLDRDAIIRCDQVVFFANGAQSVQTYQVGWFSNKKGQGTVSRIYYGHAYQLGDLGEAVDDQFRAHDAIDRVYPWTDSQLDGPINMARTEFQGANIFNWSTAGQVNLPQVDARKWLFARQPVILVDDDNYLPDDVGKTVYLGQVLSAYSIFLWYPGLGNSFQIYQGRVDAAATQLNDIRRMILDVDLTDGSPTYGQPQPWLDQHLLIADQLLYYPRAERYPPSMHRIDQALTNNVLGSACSSVTIDWTWEDGTGEVRDQLGNIAETPGGLPLFGIQLERDATMPAFSQSREQPWFGMPDPARLLDDIDDIGPDFKRGVGAYGDDEYRDLLDAGYPNYAWAETIPPIGTTNYLNNIERVYSPLSRVVVYEAIFGYNQDQSIQMDPADPQYLQPDVDLGYTPWPSAVRITLTLHDPGVKLENGREVQFVVKLPPRAIDMPEP